MIADRVRAALGVGLLAAGGAVGHWADTARATPRPPPDLTSVLGGFSAVAVEVLWFRADRALLDQRYAEALYSFGLISNLEPQLLAAADYFATTIAGEIAWDEPDERARGALGLTAYDILTGALRSNVTDPRAHQLRAEFALQRLATDPAMGSAFLEATGLTPLEAFLADIGEARRLAPGDISIAAFHTLACRERGREILFAAIEEGDDAAAATAAGLLDRSIEGYDLLIPHFASEGMPTVDEEDAREVARRLREIAGSPATARPGLLRALHRDLGSPPGWPVPR